MEFIQKHSQLLEDRILQLDLPAQPSNLYDPLRYFLQLGGKRMRPVLTLLGAELFGTEAEQAVHAALAIEVFHNFTLIHVSTDLLSEFLRIRVQIENIVLYLKCQAYAQSKVINQSSIGWLRARNNCPQFQGTPQQNRCL